MSEHARASDLLAKAERLIEPYTGRGYTGDVSMTGAPWDALATRAESVLQSLGLAWARVKDSADKAGQAAVIQGAKLLVRGAKLGAAAAGSASEAKARLARAAKDAARQVGLGIGLGIGLPAIAVVLLVLLELDRRGRGA